MSPVGGGDRLKAMNVLKQHITDRLGNHKSCTCFFERLQKAFAWKIDALRARQIADIEKFAEDNGWTVHIYDPGIRATFRKKVPDAAPKAARV